MSVPQPYVEYQVSSLDARYEVLRYGDCLVDLLLNAPSPPDTVEGVTLVYDTVGGCIRLGIGDGATGLVGKAYASIAVGHPLNNRPVEELRGCPLHHNTSAYISKAGMPNIEAAREQGYGHGNAARPLVGVRCRAVIMDATEEHVLLAELEDPTRAPQWTFPGGDIDAGDEGLEAACLRHVLAQCGIEILEENRGAATPSGGAGGDTAERAAILAAARRRKKSALDIEIERACLRELSEEWGLGYARDDGDGVSSMGSSPHHSRDNGGSARGARNAGGARGTPASNARKTANHALPQPDRRRSDIEMAVAKELCEEWGLSADDVAPSLSRSDSSVMRSRDVTPARTPRQGTRRTDIEEAVARELCEEWGLSEHGGVDGTLSMNECDAVGDPAGHRPSGQLDLDFDRGAARVDEEQLRALSNDWGPEISQGMINPLPKTALKDISQDWGVEISQGMILARHVKPITNKPHAPQFVYKNPTDPARQSAVQVEPVLVWEESVVAGHAGDGHLPEFQELVVYMKVKFTDLEAADVTLAPCVGAAAACCWVDVGVVAQRRAGGPHATGRCATGMCADGQPLTLPVGTLLPPYDPKLLQREGMAAACEAALGA